MENKTKIELILIIVAVISILLISGCVQNKCGDGICQGWEERRGSCTEDCEKIIPVEPKAEKAVCGNNICEEGETSENCPQDCAFPILSLDFFDATTVHPNAKSFQLAFYEKNKKRVIFLPWGPGDEPLGVLLSYQTTKPFKSPSSYQAVDLTQLIDQSALGFGTGFIDDTHDWLYLVAYRKKSGTEIVKNGLTIRFDLHKDLSDPTAYEKFDLKILNNIPHIGWVHGGYLDGYVYYAPTMEEGTKILHGILLRYDTSREFNDPAAWDWFDLEANVHSHAKGFQSAEVKYPYIYLIPFGAGGSHFVRYDVTKPFDIASSYEVFDISTLHPDAKGYTLSIVVNDSIVFTPWRDLSKPVSKQFMSLAAMFNTTKPLNDSSAWSFIDLALLDPKAQGYEGAWADKNGFVYFVPTFSFVARESPPLVVWNSKKPFDMPDSWGTYLSDGVPASTGAAFDEVERVWLAPYGTSRYPSGLITQIKILGFNYQVQQQND